MISPNRVRAMSDSAFFPNHLFSSRQIIWRLTAVGLLFLGIVFLSLAWLNKPEIDAEISAIVLSSNLAAPAEGTVFSDLVALTDETGAFSFTGLNRASHPVWIDLPSLSSVLGQEYSNDIRLNTNPGFDYATSIDGIGLRASYSQDGSQITGLVWHDENANATLDAGEVGIPGVTVIDPGVHVYYVPFDDDFLATQFYEQVDSAGCIPGNRILPDEGTRAIISITTGESPVSWIYDHYEDGYETDLTNPAQTTSLSGNLLAGGSQVFSTDRIRATTPPSNTNITPNTSTLPFDGRDRVVIIGEPINFVRIAMAEGVNFASLQPPVTAMASEAARVTEWGTSFKLVWGTDLSALDANFGIVVPFILANDDNTTVTIDADGPGGAGPQIFTLAAGEVLDPSLITTTIHSTGTVTTDRPVQVTMGAINCSQANSFGIRAMNLEPLDQWSNDYYSPIPSFPASCTDASINRQVNTGYQLTNPGNSAITVNIEGSDTATIVIPPNSTVIYQATTTQSGIHFYTTNSADVFYVASMIDRGLNGASGGDTDWGFSLLPAAELTSQAIVGWSDGNLASPPNQLYSLAWLTPVTDTIIYVDLNSDGTPDEFDSDGDGVINVGSDAGVAVAALDLLRIANPATNSLRGATIYTLDYSERFAMVFGQDPCRATRGGTAIDLGFTIRPLPVVTMIKSAILAIDADKDGSQSPGDTIEWTISFQNIGRSDLQNLVLTDVIDFLDDSLPCTADFEGGGSGDCADWIPASLSVSSLPPGAVPTSTLYGITQNPLDITLLSDSSATEAFKLNWTSIAPLQLVSVTFRAILADPLPLEVTSLANQALLSANDLLPVRSTDPVDQPDPDTDTPIGQPYLEIRKYHLDDDVADLIGFGDIFSYTIVITNTGSVTAVNTVMTDTLPPQLTYQSGSLDVSLDGANFSDVPDPVQNLGSTLVLTNSLNLGAGRTVTYTFDVQLTSIPTASILWNVVETDADNLHLQTQNPGTPGGFGGGVGIGDDGLDAQEPVTIAFVDLELSKVDSGELTVTPGQFVTYTLTFTNNGNTTATGVVISETVPANTTFITGTTSPPPGWVCLPDNNANSMCTFNVGTVLSATTGSITFTVRLDNPWLGGSPIYIANAASIGDDGTNGPDPTPNDNDRSIDTPRGTVPDLQITKTDDVPVTGPGGAVIYTLAFSNVGTITATGVTITETVPANTTYNPTFSAIGWTCTPPAGPAGSPCTFSVGVMAGISSGTITFAITVDNPLPSGVNAITNTVEIADDGTFGPDLTPNNNRDTEPTPITGGPDLILDKDQDTTIYRPGNTITWTIAYTNVGSRGATGVVITETVPTNTVFNSSASPSGWSCVPGNSAGSICTYAVGALPVSATGSVTYVVNIDNPLPAGVNTITNSAQIADDGTNGPDPTPNNNRDAEPRFVANSPDLTITKDDGRTIVSENDVLTYTLVYSNIGIADATGVVITETVPDNTTFVGPAIWTGCTPGSPGGTVCTTNVGTLSPNQSGSRLFSVAIVSPLPTGTNAITNVVRIGDDGTHGPDPTPQNNTDDDADTLLPPALEMDKSINIFMVAPNQIVTYTVVLTNIGGITFDPVIMTDTLQAGLTFVPGTASPTETSATGQTIFWADVMSGAGLAPGQSTQITYQVSVTTTPGTYTNTAQTEAVYPGGSIPDQDQTPVIVEDPALILNKDMDSVSLADGFITYTIRITNTGLTILDQVPLFDTFTQNTINYFGGTPTPDVISNTNGVIAWNNLTTNFGINLFPGQTFVVTTVFQIVATTDVFTAVNQAAVNSATDVFNNPANPSDDTTTTPLAVDLLYFQGEPHTLGVLLKWATAIEYDNFGFRLLRSSSSNLADATEIAFIPGQGHGTNSGASYSYLDDTAQAGQTVTYWLIDIDFNGVETVNGPATVTTLGTFEVTDRAYLPLIFK